MSMLRARSLHVSRPTPGARLTIHAVVDNDVYPPLFGSTQRSFGLLRGLAREHDVHVLCIVPRHNAAARDETADGVHIVRAKAWYTSLAWRLEQLRLSPLFLSAHGHAARAGRLLGLLPGSPNALLVGPWFGGLYARTRAPLKVYASQNVEYDHFHMTAHGMLGRSGWAERARSIERSVVSGSDLVVTCSHEDALRMGELYGLTPERTLVAVNGYDESSIRPPTVDERRTAREALGFTDEHHVGVFLGSDAPTNRDALRVLLETVVPQMDPARFRLLVAGEISSRVGGAHPASVVTRPAREDVLPYLHAAEVGLNPVTVGGGSNVKVPTYLGAGLSVITTPFGLRGYERLESLVVTAPVESFASAWRKRPQGWATRDERMPEAVAEHQWGHIGRDLGRRLVRHLHDADAIEPAMAHGRFSA